MCVSRCPPMSYVDNSVETMWVAVENDSDSVENNVEGVLGHEAPVADDRTMSTITGGGLDVQSNVEWRDQLRDGDDPREALLRHAEPGHQLQLAARHLRHPPPAEALVPDR